jgi:hypothetical protein
MIVETYEQALELITEAGRVWAAEHDAEFERHLGFKKAHMFHAPARRELVHMYSMSKQAQQPNPGKGKGKDGKPVRKPNLGQTLKGMMQYHGYKSKSPKDAVRQVYVRDGANKYHEIHVDLDKKGEPRSIMHKERFK